MIKDDRPPNRVFVELDALLDTRLATVSRLSEEAALTCLNDDRYFSREIDDFTDICGIGKEEFRKAYKQRDVRTLEASIMTEVPFIVAELTHKLELDVIDTPFASEVIVEINCHPYVLDEEEKEAVAMGVASRCGEDTKVVCVDIPLDQLTPGLILERYSGLIIYNFRDWMEVQLEAFKSTRMPRVSVLAPALFYDEIPKPDEFTRNGIAPNVSAFQLAETAAVELYALSLLPAINFSIARIPGLHVPASPKKQ